MSFLTQKQNDAVRPRNAELAAVSVRKQHNAFAELTELRKDRERLEYMMALHGVTREGIDIVLLQHKTAKP